MNLFQWLTLPLLAALLLAELLALVLGRTAKTSGLVRCSVWLLAALAIAYPELTQRLAVLVGIHRGADLVFYLFVFAFLGTTFYFYAAQVRLRRELTEMVRHVAILEVRRGAPPASAGEEHAGPAGP
jgi:hypothetical protein